MPSNHPIQPVVAPVAKAVVMKLAPVAGVAATAARERFSHWPGLIAKAGLVIGFIMTASFNTTVLALMCKWLLGDGAAVLVATIGGIALTWWQLRLARRIGRGLAHTAGKAVSAVEGRIAQHSGRDEINRTSEMTRRINDNYADSW